MTEVIEHKPNPHYVWINESWLLNPDTLVQCGSFHTLYVYDASVGERCCEITPSYWLEAAGFETQNEIDDDLHEELGRDLHESSHYRHCGAVITFCPKQLVGDFEDMEEVLEYIQGNPPCR